MLDAYDCTDILWVDDFAEAVDTSDLRIYLSDYFPEEYRPRVHVEKSFLKLLRHLETHLQNYSCAVLDIDLKESFKPREGADAQERQKEEEEICSILKNCQVNAGDPEHEGKLLPDFGRNAGYYLYLYLVHCGMPVDRIAMLSGNVGEENRSGDWDRKFRDAGILPPETFDRKRCELKRGRTQQTTPFTRWLDAMFRPAYRLRSAIVGMTASLQELLSAGAVTLRADIWGGQEAFDASVFVHNLHMQAKNISLQSFRATEQAAADTLRSLIWNLVGPWEAAKRTTVSRYSEAKATFLPNEAYAYVTTVKTARNWLMHYCLQQIDLQVEGFLFGVGLRGLFDFPDASDARMTKYIFWENELLQLLQELDANYGEDGTQGFPEDVLASSCKEFFHRTQYEFDYGFTQDIYRMLLIIGDKRNTRIPVYQEDLLRAFLHGVYTLFTQGWISSDRYSEVPQFSMAFKPHRFCLNPQYRASDRSKEYLDHVKYRIQHGIAEAQKK